MPLHMEYHHKLANVKVRMEWNPTDHLTFYMVLPNGDEICFYDAVAVSNWSVMEQIQVEA